MAQWDERLGSAKTVVASVEKETRRDDDVNNLLAAPALSVS